MSKDINLTAKLEKEKTEQDNSTLEGTQPEADVTKQNDLNSMAVTDNNSSVLNSPVQPVTPQTGFNNPVIFSSSFTEKIIDNGTVDRIKSSMAQANPDTSGKKRIKINLDSTKANFSDTNDLITHIHNINNDCDVYVNCTGTLDLAATTLACACKYGSRNAPFNSTFSFFENSKHSGKKRKVLSANEQIALSVISKYSKKKISYLKKLMSEGKTIVANEAKKIGIIDNVTGLEDRDASERNADTTGKK